MGLVDILTNSAGVFFAIGEVPDFQSNGYDHTEQINNRSVFLMTKVAAASTILGRRGTPEEIANAYAFLASDAATDVTEALWVADGGTNIAKGPAGDRVGFRQRLEPTGELDLYPSLDRENTKQLQQAYRVRLERGYRCLKN